MSLALKVLIVEDETPAAEKLERYLNKFNPAIKVVEKIGTIKETVSWLQSNQSEIDLIFMDIQLHDGLSFQIFQQVDVQKPVIFITSSRSLSGSSSLITSSLRSRKALELSCDILP